ncbi:hypothetical protein MA04_03073 [Alcanivorax balearicus MACL04]|uniref:Lipoprotein n=1 Tax=Alloalcanivorax balearicus MACL04 TaxID=1177182 RepID=A0ABT2R1Y4_9GAMM|nr:hypothetical protein [Alloalcanivorax balearicus]MCU5783773.1 hypothetical protein [Alloalcanivorax balearicus MACL04]
MENTRRIATPLLVALLILAGCDSTGETGTKASPNAFHSDEYGIGLAYDNHQAHAVTETGGYFGDPTWRLDAEADAPGERLLVLRLNDSDEILTGELRLGVSRDPDQVKHCTRPGALATSSETGTTELDGALFTTYRGGDAAMNHFQNLRAYRAVHQSTCYAIDLVLQGTNPEVYDPPREAPFSREEGFARLKALLSGVAFDEKPKGRS